MTCLYHFRIFFSFLLRSRDERLKRGHSLRCKDRKGNIDYLLAQIASLLSDSQPPNGGKNDFIASSVVLKKWSATGFGSSPSLPVNVLRFSVRCVTIPQYF